MHFKKFIVLMMLGVIASAQDDDDNDGKYRPDAIPVWEHERQDYTFSYGVKDLHTGDVKNQWEKKVGDTIHGHYTVLEPDGSLRIVHYTADEKNGFNAVVKHEGPSYHPVTIPTSHHTQHNHHSHVKTHAYYATQTASQKPTKHITKYQPIKKPKLEEQIEDTQSINIEPQSELEAIDAYLYIPSQHNQHQPANTQYELLSDDKYQHFVTYDVPHNHKPTYKKIQPNLKIKTTEHEAPISYDLLTPVTIDFTQIDYDHLQQHEGGVFVEPQIETGFKPLPKGKGQRLPVIPNTFTTNKRPITTPGLKTYASDQARNRPHLRGPVIFPKRIDKERLVLGSTSRRNVKNGPRYTKHVAYVQDDY